MKIEEFEELKNSSLGHALIKAGRLYNDYAFNLLKDSIGDEDLRQSHVNLFPYIPFSGITIVSLAKKAGVSKQAVSVLVNELLVKEVLVKIANPHDKRSFLISFKQGKSAPIFKGMQLLKSLDEKLIELLGTKNSHNTHQALLNIIEQLQNKK
jgi:DNA-binding MarR family transcriptional regulator